MVFGVVAIALIWKVGSVNPSGALAMQQRANPSACTAEPAAVDAADAVT
jgi:hypothetical protein